MLETALPTTFSAELPIGFTDAKGTVHREAALRKLRGTDEMLFYDPSLSGAELVTQLIHRCLVRLGNLTIIEPAVITQLFSADRNYLLYELRRITFGDEVRTTYACPACERTVHLTERLSEMAIRRLADREWLQDIVVTLEDGYTDHQKVVHREIVLTLPRGVDEVFVSKQAETDLLQARDALLLRCIKKFGSLSQAVLEGYGVKILRGLTMGDRRRLQQALNQETPGVQFQRRIECGHCGLTFDAVMDVSDFFALS